MHSYSDGWKIRRAPFIAVQARWAAVPSGAVKLACTGLAMAGNDGAVWPMGSWDGSTG